MHEKDRYIIKSSALVIADSIVSTLSQKYPGLDIAWGLSKGLYGAGMQLRQDRALKWVEMVRDNPSIFTQEILNSEHFQDGFVFAFEKYIKERNENKRKIVQNIFLGFGKSLDLNGFELEQYLNILSLLDANEISFLSSFTGGDFYTEDNVKNCNHLIQLGLIEIGDGGQIKMGLRKLTAGNYGVSSDSYNADIPLNLTYLGQQIVSYLYS